MAQWQILDASNYPMINSNGRYNETCNPNGDSDISTDNIQKIKSVLEFITLRKNFVKFFTLNTCTSHLTKYLGNINQGELLTACQQLGFPMKIISEKYGYDSEEFAQFDYDDIKNAIECHKISARLNRRVYVNKITNNLSGLWWIRGIRAEFVFDPANGFYSINPDNSLLFVGADIKAVNQYIRQFLNKNRRAIRDSENGSIQLTGA